MHHDSLRDMLICSEHLDTRHLAIVWNKEQCGSAQLLCVTLLYIVFITPLLLALLTSLPLDSTRFQLFSRHYIHPINILFNFTVFVHGV